MGKGQFYIVTAAILVMVMVGIYMAAGAGLRFNTKREAGYTLDNIETDFVRAANIVLAEDSSSSNIEARMEEYMNFTADFMTAKNKELSGHFAIGVPQGSRLYLTFGNLGTDNISGIEVNVSGESQNLSTLQPHETYTFFFPLAFSPPPADINYTFDGLGEVVSFSIGRVTFYRAEILVSEGENVWKAITESY